MRNHGKSILWPLTYPNPNCTFCPNHEIDTWPHLLSTCTHPHIKNLCIAQQSSAPNSPHTLIQQTHKVLCPSKCQHMLPQHMHGLVETCHIMYTKGPHRQPYTHPPPPPNLSNTIQFIDFTYCHYRFPNIAKREKTNKYDPLIQTLNPLGWNVDPLITITIEV